MSDAGVAPSARIVHALACAGGGQTVGELAERTGRSRQSVGHIVKRLYDAGLFDREPRPTDTRGRPKYEYQLRVVNRD